MYTVSYIAPTPYGWKLFNVTTPSEGTAKDVAAALRASGDCLNVKVWHKGSFEKF